MSAHPRCDAVKQVREIEHPGGRGCSKVKTVPYDFAYSLEDENERLRAALWWIAKHLTTASDGGRIWCAVRELSGAGQWAKELDDIFKDGSKDPLHRGGGGGH